MVVGSLRELGRLDDVAPVLAGRTVLKDLQHGRDAVSVAGELHDFLEPMSKTKFSIACSYAEIKQSDWLFKDTQLVFTNQTSLFKRIFSTDTSVRVK